jgi:hypothetical protein
MAMTDTRSIPEDANNAITANNANNTSASQISGTAAGHLALVPTWMPLDIAPEYNSAGSGGDGVMIGTIESMPMGIFTPSNAAIAGPHSSAEALQANTSIMYQHSTEMAGIGGDGGTGNVAIGGGNGLANHAGSGGNGLFLGGMVSADTGVFAPVNLAVAAGPDSHAQSNQTNNAAFVQGADQIGGVGGSGGSHNVAVDGLPPSSSSDHGTTYILTGDNYAGHGGDGTFIGSMVDVNVAIFSPINIAVGAAGGNAEAHQTNNAVFSQGGMQIAGIGGAGGGFNLSSGTIFTGDHAAGGGGTGYSNGSMVDVNVGYFHPVNIAVPAGGTADALQTDHLLVDQHSMQMAGLGGAGGEGNVSDSHAALVDDILHGLHT